MKLFARSVMWILASACCTGSEVPRVDLDYTPLFDRTVAEIVGGLDERASSELKARLPEFRAAWQKQGPVLLSTAVKLTGVEFKFGETRAALMVSTFPTISHPLLINMREYLKSASGPEKVQPLDVFVDTVFHEILHRYISDILRDRTTPLLEKYADESFPLRNHLHLFALQQLVYEDLGKSDQLGAVVAAERALKGAPMFARARSIVSTEGARMFLAELKFR